MGLLPSGFEALYKAKVVKRGRMVGALAGLQLVMTGIEQSDNPGQNYSQGSIVDDRSPA